MSLTFSVLSGIGVEPKTLMVIVTFLSTSLFYIVGVPTRNGRTALMSPFDSIFRVKTVVCYAPPCRVYVYKSLMSKVNVPT